MLRKITLPNAHGDTLTQCSTLLAAVQSREPDRRERRTAHCDCEEHFEDRSCLATQGAVPLLLGRGRCGWRSSVFRSLVFAGDPFTSGAGKEGGENAQGTTGSHPDMVHVANQQQHIRGLQQPDSSHQISSKGLSYLPTLSSPNTLLLRKTNTQTRTDLATEIPEEPFLSGIEKHLIGTVSFSYGRDFLQILELEIGCRECVRTSKILSVLRRILKTACERLRAAVTRNAPAGGAKIGEHLHQLSHRRWRRFGEYLPLQ